MWRQFEKLGKFLGVRFIRYASYRVWIDTSYEDAIKTLMQLFSEVTDFIIWKWFILV